MWIHQWTTRARCRRVDPDALFVQGAAQNRAKLICRDCPVRTECLVDALDNRVVIERAVGVIMQRDQLSAVAAFNRLRQAARSSQTKAADVAEQLLAELGTNH